MNEIVVHTEEEARLKYQLVIWHNQLKKVITLTSLLQLQSTWYQQMGVKSGL